MPDRNSGNPLKRRAIIATISIQLALIDGSSAWAAGIGGGPSSGAPLIDSTAMGVARARLSEAMAHALPIADSSPTQPAPKIPAAYSDQHCTDSAIAPAIVHKMVSDEAARQNVDIKLAETIAGQESGFGANVNSPAAAAAGAMGVMQLIAATAAHYRVADRCDVAENVRGGVSLIGDLSTRFSGNVFLILAAYNAGEGRVTAAKGVPSNSQTVRYVAAGANAYFDFAGALKAQCRSAPDGADPAIPDPATVSTDSVGQKWIGGTVLYVEQEKTP
jgi:soluble lytic murein transglycosylase-like protein